MDEVDNVSAKFLDMGGGSMDAMVVSTLDEDETCSGSGSSAKFRRKSVRGEPIPPNEFVKGRSYVYQFSPLFLVKT